MHRNMLAGVVFLWGLFLCAGGGAFGLDQQSGSAAAPQFFTALQDVPLMPGLRELPELTVIFDKPEGRIIESVAAMDSLVPAAVQGYYETSLPQFGWSRIAEGSFARQNEFLRLTFDHIDGQAFLRIMVTPHE